MNTAPAIGEQPQRRQPQRRDSAAQAARRTDDIPAARSGAGALALEHIVAARECLRGAVRVTPCHESRQLGAEAGVRLFLKRDDLQATGSFKERGACNALVSLSAAERTRGVVAASAGNHALGLAHHGARLGVPVTLVMPTGAARVKIERCRALGAEVVLAGETFDAAEIFARSLAQEKGRTYVHPFDDARVMAGQGTLALEVLEQNPDLSTIVVPVGGGGLLAGVCVALKTLRPDVRVIAVEPEAAPSYSAAWRRGRPVRVELDATFADGLAVARVGQVTLAASRPLVDRVVTVSEEEIATAMLRLFEVERATVEGAGAVALAAVLAGKLTASETASGSVVVPVCGANIDAATFARALQCGLAHRAARQERLAS